MFNKMFCPDFIAALDTEENPKTNRMQETPDNGLDDDERLSPHDTAREEER